MRVQSFAYQIMLYCSTISILENDSVTVFVSLEKMTNPISSFWSYAAIDLLESAEK